MATDDEKRAEIERILKAPPKDFFAVLGMDPLVVEYDDLKAVHKSVVLKVHPDKCQGIDKAKDAFAVADEAYKKLKDEAMFKRFKDAFIRKAKAKISATEASRAQRAGLTPEEEERLRDGERQERYMAAVREDAERDAKKHRREEQAREETAAKAEIAEQRAQFESLAKVFGTTASAAAHSAAKKPSAAKMQR